MLSRSEEVPELLEVVAGDLVSVEEGLVALDTHKSAVRNHAETVSNVPSNQCAKFGSVAGEYQTLS